MKIIIELFPMEQWSIAMISILRLKTESKTETTYSASWIFWYRWIGVLLSFLSLPMSHWQYLWIVLVMLFGKRRLCMISPHENRIITRNISSCRNYGTEWNWIGMENGIEWLSFGIKIQTNQPRYYSFHRMEVWPIICMFGDMTMFYLCECVFCCVCRR